MIAHASFFSQLSLSILVKICFLFFRVEKCFHSCEKENYIFIEFIEVKISKFC